MGFRSVLTDCLRLQLGGSGESIDDDSTVAAAGVLTPATSIRLPQYASVVQCQYGGKKKFEPVLLQVKKGSKYTRNPPLLAGDF